MASTNITLSKVLSPGGAAKTVTINNVEIKEDYDNQLIIINPGKGSSGQGVDITAAAGASKTTIKNRLRITHAIELTGQLVYDGTHTAEFKKNLLIQMVLYGKESESEHEVSLAGLKKINSSGTEVAVTLKGLIKKIGFSEAPQDIQGITNEAQHVTFQVAIQFIEGASKDGFLEPRFQQV